MRVIALCGEAGSGKSTVADYLAERHEFDVVSLATPLKELVRDVFGLEWRHVFGSQADKAEFLPDVRGLDGKPRTPREILEHVGTEGFRHIDPDVWVKKAQRTIHMLKVNGSAGVVIADARFANELRMVKELGGEVWMVTRVGGGTEARDHASDREWRGHVKDRHLVARSGDMAGLREQAQDALDAYGRSV